MEAKSFRNIIVGAGPCGLSAVEALLDNNTDPNSILIIDPNIDRPILKAHLIDKNISQRAVELKRNKGAKSSHLNEDHGGSVRQSDFWGASHFPPVNFDSSQWGGGTRNINQVINQVASTLKISENLEDYLDQKQLMKSKITTDLKQKKIAQEIENAPKSPFKHSLLSINIVPGELNTCKNSGQCFQKCPTQAFWNATSHLSTLRFKYPGLNVLSEKVTKILSKTKEIEISPSKKITYSRLYLAAGPVNSYELLKKSELLSEFHKMKNTPVIMVPFLGPKTTKNDFFSSVVCCDLVLPQFRNKNLVGFTQLYFATHELSSNILSTLPKILLIALRKVSNLTFYQIFKRIGIAMIFGGESLDGLSERETIAKMKINLKHVRKTLPKFKLFPFMFIKKTAFKGDSYHVGALYDERYPLSSKNLNQSAIALEKHSIYLVDALGLPQIPPGPHTFSSMVIGRMTVKDSLR
jgi:ferredoxin